MNRSLTSLVAALCLPALFLLLIFLLLCPVVPSEARPQRSGLAAAWERAREAGSYRFAADVVQTRVPLATVGNVGRQSRQDAFYIEGQTNLPARALDLTLWSDGGSLLDARDGVEVRVEGDRALVRRGAGSWEEIDDFTGLFAPGSDFMAYLAATRDVVERGRETRAGVTFTRYTFEIDGRRFAAHMRDQMQRHLLEEGELPPGVSLELPRAYLGMSGEGELWVGEDGLPLRQILHLDFPDMDEERLQADVTVTFSGFGDGAARTDRTSGSHRRWLQQAMLFVAALTLVGVAVVYRRSRRLYASLVAVLIFSMVVTPPLQSAQAAGFARRQAERVREQERRAQEAEMARDFQSALSEPQRSSVPSGPAALAMIRNDDHSDSDRDGLTDVQEIFLGTDPTAFDLDLLMSPARAPLRVESGADSDGDGLTDYQEEMLGTDPQDWDTDGDALTDTLEIEGCVFTDTHGVATTFHTDPLDVDTNKDGVEDGYEWYTNGSADGRLPGDTDGDGVPDPFDRDNDDDGVPDHVDMSPFQTTLSGTAMLTQTIVLDDGGIFDQDRPFSLIVDNLVAGRPTYVEFQLRPTDPQHLWYAQNVLDWPEDRQGQVQDGDGATFYDVCWDAATAGGKNPDEECKRSPDENGDLKLVPMLEIRIAGPHDNLPPTTTLESMYGVFVQDLQADGSEKAAYVPLQLIYDNKGGARVAFYGKMLYMPEESWGDAQQVRLVWAVQALVDRCDDFEDGQCVSYGATNEVQVVHTYYDEWFLTGLNVREDHGQDVAVIWEDPGVDGDLHSDDTLIKLTHALDGAFMAGRLDPVSLEPDITVDELYRRFNHTTNGSVPSVERWELPDVLSVLTGTFAHQDEALYTLAVTTTRSVLTNTFTPHWSSADPITPTLLFVRSERYRSTNLDVWGNGYGFFWGGRDGSGNPRELTVDIGSPDPDAQHSQPVVTMVGQKWMPYCYDGFAWEPCPIDVYWDELDSRYDGVSETDDPTEAAGERLLFQFYYLTLYQGVTSVVRAGGRSLQDALGVEPSSDVALAQSIVGGVNSGFLFIVNFMVKKFSVNSHLITSYLGSLSNSTYTLTVGDKNPHLLKRIKVLFQSNQYKAISHAYKNGFRWAVKHSIGVLGAGLAALGAVVTLALGVAFIIASFFNENKPGLRIAGKILVGTGQFLMGIVLPIYTVWTMANSLKGPGLSFFQAFKGVLAGKSEVIGSTTKASIVGLILSIGITIVFFVVQVAQGGLNSIQISMLVAQALAQIIIAILYFVISETVIGTLIVALLGLIDLILSLVGLEEWTSAALLARAIYGYALIAEPGVEVAGIDIGLVDPSKGMVDGAQLVVTATITASATMTNPKDPRAIIYMPVLWTERILRSSTVNVGLSVPVSDTASVAASRRTMKDQWNVVPHHTYIGHDMRRAEVTVQRATVIELEAGINMSQPIYLNAGYALPMASCWMVPIPPLWYPVPICYDDSIKTDSASDIGASVVLDVFPATLDEFYSLAWADFGPQRDYDSDGLLSTAYAGNDPDDTTWDCDEDGLSDQYEMVKRSRGAGNASAPSPTSRDTDGDGLCDDQEIRLGTFPNQRDSDGDLLDDGEEVFHRDCWTGEWTGGWDFVVTSIVTLSGGLTDTLVVTTHVTSDPLVPDTDVDGLDDKAEHTLGTHPRVETPSPIALRVETDDDDDFVAPSQTFVYTATVENQIEHDPPLFYAGGLTVDMPALLGGGSSTTTYNLYQGESASLSRTVTVNGGAPSGPVTVTNRVAGFMHDGDLTTYYRWEPLPFISDDEPVEGPAYVRIAAPPQSTLPTFAVASVEGTETIGYRTADSEFSASTPDVLNDTRPGPGLGGFPPGVACADDGTCLVTWGSTYYDNCAFINFKGFYCVEQWDEGGGFNPRSEFNVLGNYGSLIWSVGGVNDGDQFDLSGLDPYYFCDQAYINVYERDCGINDSFNADDHMGTSVVSPYSTCKGDGTLNVKEKNWHGDQACGHRFSEETDWRIATADLWWETDLTILDTIDGAVLDSGAAIQESRFGISAGVQEGILKEWPAVASDGTDFLVVWQQYTPSFVGNEAPNWTIYARQVDRDGSSPAPPVRLDAVWDFGVQRDERPAVAWIGDRYLVVWQTDRPDNIHTVSRALVSQNGQMLERHNILGDIYTRRARPQVAYNPDTDQALLVYIVNDLYIKGRLVEGSSVGEEFTIGVRGANQTLGSPAVAYEPRFGLWLVGWDTTDPGGTRRANYAVLRPGGQVAEAKEGLGPSATHSELRESVVISGLLSHGLACSQNTTDYALCGGAASTDDSLAMVSLFLDDVPPSLGGIAFISRTLVHIDADPPTSTLTSLAAGQKYAYTGTLIVGGDARDPGGDGEASGVARVEVSGNGGSTWESAVGGETWFYTYTLPATDGWYTLRTRATDMVGNQETSPTDVTFYLDRTPPTVVIADPGQPVSATLAGERWYVPLQGTVADAGSGVDSVEVMLSPNGDGWQRATLNGGNWGLSYRLTNGLPDPSAVYTVLARATDTAIGPDGGGNRSDPVTRTLYVDNAPPLVSLTDTGSSTTTITNTLRIGGTITDPAASGVQGLDIAFTLAGEPPAAWQPAVVESPTALTSTWYYTVQPGLEGNYQIDLCGTDVLSNRCQEEATLHYWRGEIDTSAPRMAITTTYRGAGSAAQAIYEGRAEDLNLTTDGYSFPCPLQRADRGYYDNAWWSGITSDTQRLVSLAPFCVVNGFPTGEPVMEACDLHGHCDVFTGSLPSGYTPPTVASAVLVPPHEGVVTTVDPLSLTVGAYAAGALRALTVTVDGDYLDDATWPCTPLTDTVTDTLWLTTWDPPGEGRYTLLAVAEGCTGTLQATPQAISVTVDVYDPLVTFPTTVLTTAHRLSLGRLVLTGTATDTVGLESVEVGPDPWDEAFFDGAIWRYPWYLAKDPDDETYTVTVRAVDAAGHVGQVTKSVTVDLVPPTPVTVTLSYTGSASAGVVVAGDTIAEPNVTLNMDWTASSDGSGVTTYWADWSLDPAPSALTQVTGRHYEEAVSQPQPFYAHLVVRDAYGNEQAHTLGPVYVDAPTTPNYVADLGYHGWMESGCSQIGADHELARNAYSDAALADVQRLYAAWNADDLRLTWTGANWDSDGDLFIYLDTGSGGTGVVYDPYSSGPTITLPDMAADYLIQVEDGATARLMQRSGGTWQTYRVLTETNYRLDTSLAPVYTDLLIPWAWLGSPASLKLLALATEEEALRVWAAVPDKNPLNSRLVVDGVALDYLDQDYGLTQQYEWASLGSGVCPNGGAFADADLHVSLTADPPGVEVGFLAHDLPSLLAPGVFLDADLDGAPDVTIPVDVQPVLVGHGEVVTYTIVYTNEGAVVAPGARVTVAARGGVALAGGSPQVIPLTGVSGTIHITGTVDKYLNGHSAEVDGVVADAAHGEFDWLWVQHGVDTDMPENLEIETPLQYINAYTNTVSGSADDPSGVPTVTLQVYDVPTGTLVAEIACPDPTPNDGVWTCLWNAGGAADGTRFDLRVRAVDRFGNGTGWTGMRRVEVDATPPTVHLSDDTQLALADNVLVLDELGLTGHVLDDREPARVGVCLGPLGGPAEECALYPATPITSPTVGPWYVTAPILGAGDGDWQTLYFYGLDSVGNRSVTTTRATRVDVVAPVVTLTTQLAAAPQGLALPVLEGEVSDGFGVVTTTPSTRLYVSWPDGHVEWYPLEFAGSDWSYTHLFTETGDYTLGFEFRDRAGNLHSDGPFPLTVYTSDRVVDLSLGLSTSSDPAITTYPLTYTFAISNAGPGIATTSTLTITLPAPAGLDWVSHPYSMVGGSIVINVGDVLTDTPTLVQARVSVPLTTTGPLACAAEVGSGKVELRPGDNRPEPLSTEVAQPITGLATASDAPTVLGESTTLTATIASGTRITFAWSLGDGESARTFGGYEVGGTSVVSHVYPLPGVYTAVLTASNIVNAVTATARITTDIPLGVSMFYEGFEDGFLPPGWLRTEPLEDQTWHWGTRRSHNGLYSAMYDDLFGSQDGWLVMPPVTPTLGSELVFWQYQNYASLYEGHSIWVSLGSDDPKDGDFVLLADLGPGMEDTWEEVRVDLSAYAGQQIHLAFRYEGDWSDEWYIDDVRVTARLVLAHDGPTILRQTTTMTASIATGSNPIYAWGLGDGGVAAGPVVTHTYPAPGDYTVVVTASNSVSAITGTMTVPVRDIFFLPLVMGGYTPPCPDVYEPDDDVGEASGIAADGTPQQHTFHQTGDEDWVAFDVPDDTVDYVIETFNLVGGADTVIYLFDSDGQTLLDWNDDADPSVHASRLNFNPYHTGTFYVAVVSYDPAATGCRVGYSIRVTIQP